MFYVASNIIWFLAQPSSLMWLLLAAGLAVQRWRRTERLGRRMALLGAALLAIGGLSPVSTWIMLPLEQRFPSLDPAVLSAGGFAGIIVLGGAEDGRIGEARGQLALNEAGERVALAVPLARRLPDARLIFSGGAGTVTREARPGADHIRAYWIAVGIAPERIVLEDRSLTTFENARNSAALLQPKPGQRWLLVTSAYHMPRAMALFRKAGFDMTANPVDYRTKDAGDAARFFDAIPRGLRRLDDATREWLSLIAHRHAGRIDQLLPQP